MAPDPKWPTEIPIPDATQQFLSPDVNTTARVDFTDFFLRFRHAEDAHPQYKHLFNVHQQLCKLLIEHPAMQPNLNQTFNTPANSKNMVYFVWDFVIRTFQILAAKVKPQNPESSPMYKDVLGRSMQTKMMITDETGMMAAMMGGGGGGGVSFTDKIKQLARTIDQFPSA
ncbi:hypothetical protein MCOR25_000123 [Pyricularia grisea]|nr:hypothetical protein MCOR25_000123 [Pyricularia grisea]